VGSKGSVKPEVDIATAMATGVMIERILPSRVVAEEAREDFLDVALFPEERAVLGQAVDKRRLEFTTARACARQALRDLGLPSLPIPAGARGEPLWPAGVVGSITHCHGYRACAAAHAKDFIAIGIDAEPHLALPDGVLDEIAGAEELRGLRALARAIPRVHWDRLLFSAKESVYKAWFPLTGKSLGFDDALLDIDPRLGTFLARLPACGPMSEDGAPVREDGAPGPVLDYGQFRMLSGRWLVCNGLVLTAIVLPRVTQRSG
jgi:4'-phosphopantetheinyl transferase EntD